MIKFDASKLSVEIVRLKMVTTALGGSISIVDEDKSTDALEVLKRISVPLAVTRHFIEQTKKVTRYLKPVYTAVVRYGNHVVALERHPLAGLGELETEGLYGKRRWMPECESNLETLIKPMIASSGHNWYFDGRYVYSFSGSSVERAVGEGDHLTHDGQFRKVAVVAIDLQHVSDKTNIAPSTRTCMAFVSSTGEMAVSPPIWKNISDIGSSKMKKGKEQANDDDDDDDDVEVTVNNLYTFDTINDMFAVNLNFALKAGREIGQTFGYENVEPLQLARLMIELHTTNLPNVPKQVKATYDIGLPFTHVLAWLIGMSRQANTLETFVMMRSLMKYLTKKGIFKADKFNADRVFKAGQNVNDVPQLSMEDLTDESARPVFSDVLEQVRAGSKRKSGIYTVGTIVNEDDE